MDLIMDPIKDQLLDSFLENSTTLAALCSNDALQDVGNFNSTENNVPKYFVEYIFNETMLTQICLQQSSLCFIKCSWSSCKAVFKLEENFKYHLKCHSLEEDCYTCVECFEKLNSWPQLQYHLWQIHELDLEMVTCEMCGYKADCQELLNSHKVIHVGKRFFKCEICNEVFSWYTHLIKHLAAHEREMVAFSSSLSDMHSEGQQCPSVSIIDSGFKCEVCQKIFEEESKYTAHGQEHSTCECHICFMHFADVKSLYNHKVVMHNCIEHKCNQCNFKSLHNINLEHHIKLNHSIEKQPDKEFPQDIKISSLSESEYKCPYCDYASSGLLPYKIHLKVKHIGKPIVFACKFCTFVSSKWTSFQEHLNTHNTDHSHVLSCSFCGYITRHSSALKVHMRQHTGEKPYQCDICDYKTAEKYRLKYHKMKHSGEKLFHCAICNYSAMRADLYKIHLKSKHEGQGLFTCSICTCSFVDESKFQHHAEAHKDGVMSVSDVKDIDKKICSMCDYSTYRISDFRRHLRQHTGEKPFQCDICDYKTDKRYRYESHVRKHAEERLYKCPHCDYNTKQNFKYKLHLITKHPKIEKLFSCELCSFISVGETELQEHINAHKKGAFGKIDENEISENGNSNDNKNIINDHSTFKIIGSIIDKSDGFNSLKTNDGNDKVKLEKHSCTICNYTTNYLPHFKKHLLLHTIDNPFICDQCEYRSENNEKMKRHKLLHLGIKKHQCPYCSYAVNNTFIFKKHLKSVHPGEKGLYSCQMCCYSFVDEKKFNEHVSSHQISLQNALLADKAQICKDPTKKHICNECGYSTNVLFSFKRHSRQHTGEKPFECDQCEYKAAHKHLLKIHKMTHTGEKRFKCLHCPYAVSNDYAFKKHMATRHPNKGVFSCESCSYSSADNKKFIEHVKSHKPPPPPTTVSNSSSDASETTSCTPAKTLAWPNNLLNTNSITNSVSNDVTSHPFPRNSHDMPSRPIGSFYGSCLYESSIVKHFFPSNDLNLPHVSASNSQNNDKNEPSQSSVWPGSDFKPYRPIP